MESADTVRTAAAVRQQLRQKPSLGACPLSAGRITTLQRPSAGIQLIVDLPLIETYSAKPACQRSCSTLASLDPSRFTHFACNYGRPKGVQ
jgi:hypothetical protein